MTSKLKLDEVLGIPSGESIDDFLDGLDIDKQDELSAMATSISDAAKLNIQDIDNNLSAIQSNSSVAPTVLVDINSSMHEVEDLILLSKKMFKHVYESVISTELVDSELIHSASALLESIRLNIEEFLGFYKDRMKYVERIKIMTFLQEQRKELMRLKHQLDMEKAALQANTGAVDTEGKMMYSVENLTKILNDMEMNKQ